MNTKESLTLAEYQRRAQQTDHFPNYVASGADPRLGPLLGLAGEIGTLMAGYKKLLRDGTAYELFEANVEGAWAPTSERGDQCIANGTWRPRARRGSAVGALEHRSSGALA